MRRMAIPIRSGLCFVLALLVIWSAAATAQQRRGGGRRGSAPTPTPTRPPTPTPAPAPARGPVTPAIVIVTLTDNSTIRGTILSSDFDDVVVQPAPRPNEKTPADPLSLRWAEISKISNGLTRQKVIDDFKKLYSADQLCATCNGNRLVFCPTCKGTGHDPASAADCRTCKGELLVDCKTPKCDDGKIPCPNPNCLKLTVGTWVVKDEGLKWREFPSPGRGGTGLTVSERHLGQLVVRNGNSWTLGDKCPTCGGTTTILDPVCRATGHIPCPTCVARKDAPPCPANCEQGLVLCDTCKGTGLKAGVEAKAAPAPGATPAPGAAPTPAAPVDVDNGVDHPQ